MQTKLLIGAVDDPLEREADAVADAAMRTPDRKVPVSAAPAQVNRKCDECAEEEKKTSKVHRMPTGGTQVRGGGVAPPSVREVLRQPGRPLEATTRTFFEQRFHRNLSQVRIHDDAKASRSASDVGARAYTVGRDVVFGAGNYRPNDVAGRSLLAHELAHVMQQGGDGGTLRRAPCRSKQECKKPNPGDPGLFGEESAKQQAARAAKISAAKRGTPLAAQGARHGKRATSAEALLSANGIPLLPETFGFFVFPAGQGVVGAQNDLCSNFPAPAPAGAPPDKWCVQVPPVLEDQAASLFRSRWASPDAKRRLLLILSTAMHEMQHAHFQEAQASGISPSADCKLDTVVFHGPFTGTDYPVEHYLSEISAITAEFPAYFQNLVRHPGKTSRQLLELEEQNQVVSKFESLLGSIRALQCACSCATVDSLVTQTVNVTTSGWPANQKHAFLKTMTVRIPNVWPKALHRK